MVLLLLTFCLLLLPLWESVIVLCFVVNYFMSILVLWSSFSGRESWLLCLICLPGVSWWLSGSSLWCHGVVCGLWLGISWSHLLFLYMEVLTTVPTTEVALYRAVMTTFLTTEAVLYRAEMGTVPTMEVALYRAVMATVPIREVVLYRAVLTTVPQREVALYKAVMATVPTTEVVLYRAVMPSNYLLETSNNWFFLFSRRKTNLV